MHFLAAFINTSFSFSICCLLRRLLLHFFLLPFSDLFFFFHFTSPHFTLFGVLFVFFYSFFFDFLFSVFVAFTDRRDRRSSRPLFTSCSSSSCRCTFFTSAGCSLFTLPLFSPPFSIRRSLFLSACVCVSLSLTLGKCHSTMSLTPTCRLYNFASGWWNTIRTKRKNKNKKKNH